MDIEEYDKLIKEKGRNTKWFRYGNESLNGIARAAADIGKKTHPPPWMFKYLKKIKMHTC